MFIDFSCQDDFKFELLQDESTALKELLKFLWHCSPLVLSVRLCTPNFKQTNVFRAASSETKMP